jgi:MOSC domain-containing protein YiiM
VHVTAAALEQGLDEIRRSPADRGRVELIIRRPAPNKREILTEATLDCTDGLVGDTWLVRGNRRTPDGSANPDEQLTLMNARAAALVAGGVERRALSGDQLYVDLDLSEDNLAAGTTLELGSAVIEVTTQPHTGCAKFADRFGRDALRFVNSPVGRQLRLRGANAKVIVAGTIHVGDEIRKRHS